MNVYCKTFRNAYSGKKSSITSRLEVVGKKSNKAVY